MGISSVKKMAGFTLNYLLKIGCMISACHLFYHFKVFVCELGSEFVLDIIRFRKSGITNVLVHGVKHRIHVHYK